MRDRRLKLPRADAVAILAVALQCGAKAPRSKDAVRRIVAMDRDVLGKITPRQENLVKAEKLIGKLFPHWIDKSIIAEPLQE